VDIKDKTSFLLNGANLQDYLLQTYRTYHLYFQSILFAVGIILFIVVINTIGIVKTSSALIILYLIWGLQLYLSSSFKKIVLARGDSVNYW